MTWSRLEQVPRQIRRWAFGGAIVVAVVFSALIVHTLFGGGGKTGSLFFNEWVVSGLAVIAALVVVARAVLVRQERRVWTLLGVGVLLYGAATVYWTFDLAKLASPPFPSVADAMFLSLFPLAYSAMILLLRSQITRFPASVWLDGLIAALALAAGAVALVFRPVLANSTGDVGAVATNLAYPIGDILMVTLVVGVFALSGWRPGRRWLTLGVGFMAFFAGDCLYAYQTAAGAYVAGGVVNVLWSGALLAFAAAAWQRPREMRLQLEGSRVLLVPASFTAAAVVLLIYDHFAPINLLSVGLCSATLLVSAVRIALTFREVRGLADSRRQALTDELTGLPNRRHFYEQLSARIADARASGQSMALLMVDLDGFKEINDTLGHHAGDLLLGLIGPRLSEALGHDGTPARLGGDEFAIVLDVGTDAAQAMVSAEHVREAIERPFALRDLSVRIDASIGIAIFPGHGATADSLLQRADLAMYRTKANRSGPAVYAPDRDEHFRHRLVLVAELRGAIATGQLVAHYQPKADPQTGAIVGVEALVRWQHPAHGLMTPDLFLPVAEQTGLMRGLTLRMLDLALEQWRKWSAEGRPLPVAVNLAAANLLDEQLPGDVRDRLAQWRVPPDQLMLEISENTAMADPERSMDVLARLGELGVRLSLDDYGTGYSSLAYLKRLPVTELKIDRSFVMSMSANEDDASIVHSTIDLAQRLRLRVVAEGVENDDTWRELQTMGCDTIQGYVLSRPLPPEGLSAWLDAYTPPSFTNAATARPSPARALSPGDAPSAATRLTPNNPPERSPAASPTARRRATQVHQPRS